MYFKKLEIIGFKSFLEKTKLKFERGVTAIVGPNGCGKSNIVDSIKWVLGEQSTRAMRSTSMEDVIFSGTENQEPVNVAEVSLTLSNEDKMLPIDYDEVVISRRLYRSGESEYLINKMPVRLADVRSLIMGTGIGTSAYSIVEQGKMDMIISSKPEERRYVFEEASGITRYKTKKREAMLKLERTQENLVRINDIAREVERQINSIERQARKAEKYKVRFEELKNLEIKLANKNLKELSTLDNTTNNEEIELKGFVEKLSLELKESAISLARLREEYGKFLEGMQGIENKIMRLTTDIDKNKHVITVNTERIEELQRQVERLDCEIEKETERKEDLRVRLEEIEVKFLDINQRYEDKSKDLANFEEEFRKINDKAEAAKNSLKENRERSIDIVSSQTKAKNSLIKANADIQNVYSRIKRLKLEKENIQQEKDKTIDQLKTIEGTCGIVKVELEKVKGTFNIFNGEYTRKQEEILDLTNKKREKESCLNEVQLRRQFLQRLLSEREGINEAVKDVMRHAEAGDSRFTGVHGILSELISIKELYSESIEAILGDAAQSIVVENRDVMERVTTYLKESSLGSVNFIILDELKGLLGDTNELEGRLEDLGNLTDILIAKEPYCSVLRILLYDVYVTVSQNAAEAFMREAGDFYGCIIGEKGEVYQKGMRRSKSYSQKEFIPLFGRREKIEELSKEEGKISGEIESLNKSILTLEASIKESIGEKEALEAQLRGREIEFAEVSSKKNSALEKSNSFSEELLLLESEISEEEGNVKTLEMERESFGQTLKTLEEENTRLEGQIDSAQRDIQECIRKREETLLLMSDVKAELSGLKKEEENLAENVGREKDSYKRMEETIENKRNQINENSGRIKTLDEEKAKLEICNIEYSSSLELAEEEASNKRFQKQDSLQDIQEEETLTKSKEEKLEETKNKIRDLDIRKKELEYKRSALAEKILNAYKVNVLEGQECPANESVPNTDEACDWEEVGHHIEELKLELNKMGDVSLGAVQEHKELVGRHDFLVKQRDDLVKAKETLMETITKINRTTRELFMETFEKIKKEFNDYFRMLFNGGKAELVLMDESDVLECGIDVVVRPPGKKLHNIMQLSGGEKAMTAIALIFAIFKVNPSPFCILDEIDAPLDESNIVRFCRVLQEFLKTSQFVIVTHNRTTIQLADVLYGITMQEKGISKIVSVKFAEEAGREATDPETVAV